MKATSINHPVLPTIVFTILGLSLVVAGLLPLQLMLLVTGFGVAAFLYTYFLNNHKSYAAFAIWFAVVFIGLSIGLYRPENFNYPLIFHADSLHENGLNFSLYLNTAKTLAGYIALAFLLMAPSVGAPLLKDVRLRILATVTFPVCLISLAYLLLNLDVYVKELSLIILFGLVNLLTTCVSEEAFMRLIFQREIARFVSRYSGSGFVSHGIPLAISTLLFTATHIGPTLEITLVYSLAGFFYGLVYVLTKNVWYCISCHFLVNIIHFSFFTYPVF